MPCFMLDDAPSGNQGADRLAELAEAWPSEPVDRTPTPDTGRLARRGVRPPGTSARWPANHPLLERSRRRGHSALRQTAGACPPSITTSAPVIVMWHADERTAPRTARGPFVVWVGGSSAADVGALDLAEELDVGLGGAHLVDHQLERLGGIEGAEDAAELPGHDQFLVAEQQLLLAGRGGVDVQGGEDAALGQLAVQPHLHVPGALELLEDDLVHARAGVHQRGREDRQRAAVLDISGRAEEALGRVERRGVDATGEDL